MTVQRMNNDDPDTRIEFVPLDRIRAHDGFSYQRDLKVERVTAMVADFNPALVGVLQVTPTGLPSVPHCGECRCVVSSFHIYDGNHRLNALLKLGYEHWWCQVSDLTPEEAAKSFVQLQTQRVAVNPYERHCALVTARDVDALSIEDVMRRRGLTMAAGTRQIGTQQTSRVGAVSTVYKVHDAAGPNHLDNVLFVAQMAFDGHPAGYSMPMLSGIDKLLRSYFGQIDTSALIERLRDHSPGRVLDEAKTLTSHGDQQMTTAVARVLLRIYNRQRRSGRLDDAALTAKTNPFRNWRDA